MLNIKKSFLKSILMNVMAESKMSTAVTTLTTKLESEE